jgi:hypothetical protein
VRVILLDEAKQQFEAEDTWWREHRDAKELFAEEFESALWTLMTAPELGQRYRWKRGKLIQRMLMKKTRCHVYYFHESTRFGVLAADAGRSCKWPSFNLHQHRHVIARFVQTTWLDVHPRFLAARR